MTRPLSMEVVLVAIFLAVALSGLSLAQEGEELEYSWGEVSSVSSDKIVVKEYDYETDKEIEVTYEVDPKAEFKGVGSLKDVSVGDAVEIEYSVVDSKKVAKIIDVERLSSEEEEASSETYQQELEHLPEETPEE